MSQNQREDHAQAKYWNGFITRVEAQKVFDEQLQVLVKQAEAIGKFDAALSCIADKVGVTPADVNVWVQKKIEEATTKAQEAAKQNASSDKEQAVSGGAAA